MSRRRNPRASVSHLASGKNRQRRQREDWVCGWSITNNFPLAFRFLSSRFLSFPFVSFCFVSFRFILLFSSVAIVSPKSQKRCNV